MKTKGLEAGAFREYVDSPLLLPVAEATEVRRGRLVDQGALATEEAVAGKEPDRPREDRPGLLDEKR